MDRRHSLEQTRCSCMVTSHKSGLRFHSGNSSVCGWVTYTALQHILEFWVNCTLACHTPRATSLFVKTKSMLVLRMTTAHKYKHRRSLYVHVGNGQGTSDRTDEAGAGVQDGHCPQRGGAPAAASQQQAHAGAAGHQAGQAHTTHLSLARGWRL